MKVPQDLIEIKEYKKEGYKALIDYNTWRVAILNFIDELLPENISFFSKHNETDEVFVLLKGKCILFLGEEPMELISNLHAINMKQYKLYNVKRGIWHSHTLSKDAMVLIVENRDTSEINSPISNLSIEFQTEIRRLTKELWE